eukprot:scaffold8686_cov122-Skeletonema_menzelii.AAC.6
MPIASSSLLQLSDYNALRRQHLGNELILFYFAVALVHCSQSNPAIVVPEVLEGVFVRLAMDGNNLVVFVRGFAKIGSHIINARALREAALNGKTIGGALLNRIARYGTVEYHQSATFPIRCANEKGRMLNDDNVEIAVFHHHINRLQRDVITSVPTYPRSTGREFNTRYKLANAPGLYVNDVRKTLSDIRKIIKKRKTTVRAFVNELFELYYAQNPRRPVQRTLNHVTVVCKLASM